MNNSNGGIISEIDLKSLQSYSTTIASQSELQCIGTQYHVYNQPDYESDVLPNLSTVNVFVGQNNSGKSRLLRGLFFSHQFYYRPNGHLANHEFWSSLEAVRTNLERMEGPIELRKERLLFPLFKATSKKVGFISAATNPANCVIEIIDKLKLLPLKELERRTRITDSHLARWADESITLLTKASSADNELSGVKAINRYYIPILRGMRPRSVSGTESEDHYLNRTMRDYFNGHQRSFEKSQSHRIHTGLSLYREIRRKLLGNPGDREQVRRYEQFLGEHFFDGRTITLVPKEESDNDVVHVLIEGKDEDQRPIFAYGDGLQHIIILTFPIFMNNEPTLFFLEEPDLCLHPSYQRALLEAFFENKQHQYFLTTHSNHFIDMSLDFGHVSIFHFLRSYREASDVRFEIRSLSTPNQKLLQDLGVRASSALLTNATIWVEGQTDRLYFRMFMKRYLKYLEKEGKQELESRYKSYLEDRHYSFVEYQGANLSHWSFSQDETHSEATSKPIKTMRLCGAPFVVADGDVKDKERGQLLRSQLNEDEFYFLPCKEVENLLPPEILGKALKRVFSKELCDYELAEIVERLDSSEYTSETNFIGLGSYLDDVFCSGKTTFSPTDAKSEKLRTIKKKSILCSAALEIMHQVDNWGMTGPIETLCESLYSFIDRVNGKKGM